MRQLFQSISKKLPLLLLVFPLFLKAQSTVQLQDYIEAYKHVAMAEMRNSGIPASIKLAQAILESGFGNSELAVEANNHFGIKCHDWIGATYFYDDDEADECFRLYTNPWQSFLDHSIFLTTRPRYAELFELEPLDYESWAYGLSRAGYATNPQYPQRLIRLIREHELFQYDELAMDPAYMIAGMEEWHTPRPSAVAAERGGISTVEFSGRREIRSFNRINYIIARPGDTPHSIAQEMEVRRWQMVSYNDMNDGEAFTPGQRIYLQPKRRRGSQAKHVAREGDTMRSISHDFGIRLENLYRRNDMGMGMEPTPGKEMLLRGYKGNAIDYLTRRP